MKINDVITCIETLAYLRGSENLTSDGVALLSYVRAILIEELGVPAGAEQLPKRIATEAPAEAQRESDTEDGDVLVKERTECRKCRYRSPKDTMAGAICQYILATGKPRGCKVKDCDHYKDAKPKRTYRHTCSVCGKVFTDNSTRTKVCPECSREGGRL